MKPVAKPWHQRRRDDW